MIRSISKDKAKTMLTRDDARLSSEAMASRIASWICSVAHGFVTVRMGVDRVRFDKGVDCCVL